MLITEEMGRDEGLSDFGKGQIIMGSWLLRASPKCQDFGGGAHGQPW